MGHCGGWGGQFRKSLTAKTAIRHGTEGSENYRTYHSSSSSLEMRPHKGTEVEEEAELSDVTEMARLSSELFKMPGKCFMRGKMACGILEKSKKSLH